MADYDEYYDEDELDFSDDEAERQLKIEAFAEKVKKASKLLTHRKAPEDKRLKAAQWLGESGAPDAIRPLLIVYRHKDTSKSLKQATKYALGQFKALDNAIQRDPGESIAEALERDENKAIVQLLTDIAIEGKSTAPPPQAESGGIWTRVLGLLVLVFIVLVGLNAFIRFGGDLGGDDNGTSPTQIAAVNPEDQAAITLLTDIDDGSRRVAEVAAELQARFELAQADGGALTGCDLVFNYPTEPYPETEATITNRYPQILPLVNETNQAIDNLNQVIDVRSRVCELGRPLVAGEIEIANANLSAISNTADTLSGRINGLLDGIIAGRVPVNIGGDQPTLDETEAVEPTIIPTPTIEPQILAGYISEITNMLDEMTANRGPAGLLTQYWQDVNQTGQTGGCNVPQPDIPEDYDEIPEELLEAVPQLGQARNSLNLGLGLLRQGWALFLESCENGNLVTMSGTGAIASISAGTAFDDARTYINQVPR